MKFIKIAVILSLTALFVFACAENKPLTVNAPVNTDAPIDAVANADPKIQLPVDVNQVGSTQQIYLEACAGCHRENGEGGAAEYEGKKVKVPSFQSRGAMNASDDKLYDYIADGEQDEMPAFKENLTEAQMRDLVKFIRREFQKK